MLFAALLLFFSPFQLGSKSTISDDQLVAYLVQSTNCPKEIKDAVYLYSAEHADLTHDGRDNFIIVAKSCNAGNSGPDVHSVFSRDGNGHIEELPIQNLTQNLRETKRILFGKINYKLSADKGQLVASFEDTSERKDPLIIRYEWNGKDFHEVSRQEAPLFRTSYNCSMATLEVERAICAVEDLAGLDVKLSTAYADKLKGLQPEVRLQLQSEQREWIRKRNSSCPIYKSWVDCLKDMYHDRIEQLQSK